MNPMHYKYIIILFIFTFLPNLIISQVNGRYLFESSDTIIVRNNTDTLLNAWAGGLNSIQTSKINLNNDGIDDLFVFDRTGDQITTFVWDLTNNRWEHAPEYESQFPEIHYWALLRDFNCDGKKDIFSYVSGGIGVWKNTTTTGDLQFEKITDPYLVSQLLGGVTANLYVSKVDVPDINDIDGDGDLDVLTFGTIGSRVEYHINNSQELGYGCDSLIFEIANTCWGHFVETGFGTNTCNLYDTCTSNTASPKHSGSSLLSLDLNDDGVKDLLLGDVSFRNVVALYNDNTGVNMNTSMVSQDTAFPSNTTSIDLQIFPATFYEDVDNDGVKDLIASPNSDVDTENSESAWFYKNYGTNTLPQFAHIKNNWLQDEMIEVGSNASPILFDYDNDGLLDLFVANLGYFDVSLSINYYSQISLYKNVGTASLPEYNLITTDFANLSSLGLTIALHPTFADIDNDGDIDMFLGDQEGYIHLFKNASNNLTSMNMSLFQGQFPDDNGDNIDIGNFAKPQLFDIDSDGDYDLVIGEESGNLNYYENIGSVTSPIFRLRTSSFGDIDVSEWWTTIGYSAPILFRNNQNETQLFVGSKLGTIYHFNNIDGNFLGTFDSQDTLVGQIADGPNSAPAVGFLNNDTIIDLITGNERGGLRLYYGSDDISLAINEAETNPNSSWNVYPNPSAGIFNITTNNNSFQIAVYNLQGQLILKKQNPYKIDMTSFSKGSYIIRYQSGSEIDSELIILK